MAQRNFLITHLIIFGCIEQSDRRETQVRVDFFSSDTKRKKVKVGFFMHACHIYIYVCCY